MKILQLIPELLVEDMQKTLRFYQEVLGFKPEIIYPKTDSVFAQIRRDNIRIMLYDRSNFENEIPKLKKIKMGGSILLYVKANNLKSFYEQIKNKVTVIQPYRKTDYGTWEFTIEDCNGYLIAFSESIPKGQKPIPARSKNEFMNLQNKTAIVAGANIRSINLIQSYITDI